jgi:hypothetical protein
LKVKKGDRLQLKIACLPARQANGTKRFLKIVNYGFMASGNGKF